MKNGEDRETGEGIGRRQLLRSGAAALAAATGLARHAQAAEGQKSAPASDERADEISMKEFCETTDFAPPGADCDSSIFPDKLREPHESCEIVLGLLWCELGRGAAKSKLFTIDYDAIIAGRKWMRGRVWELLCTSTSCTIPEDKNDAFWKEHGPKWMAIGEIAAAVAAGRDSKEPIITSDDFVKAWENPNVYGATHVWPERLLEEPDDEAAETIGDQMWTVFASKLQQESQKGFGIGVIKAGRLHSRFHVFTNLKKWGVTDGTTKPDYEKWLREGTDCCIRKAAEKAGMSNGNEIDADHFHTAWCSTKELMVRFMSQSKKDFRFLAGGCGG